MAVGGDAAGKQVVHQPRLDLLHLRNQRLGLLNRFVQRRKNFGDAALLGEWWRVTDQWRSLQKIRPYRVDPLASLEI